MIAKMLIYYAFAALLGWIFPGSGGAIMDAIMPGGPFGSHASGGWTGDGPADKVSGVVHGQEFVVKAGPASQHRSMLERLNAGATMPALQTASTISASGTGGESGAAAGDIAAFAVQSAAPIINISTPANTQATATQRQGADGQSITDVVITMISGDIGRGGPIAQTMQSTFGLTRQGRRTG